MLAESERSVVVVLLALTNEDDSLMQFLFKPK